MLRSRRERPCGSWNIPAVTRRSRWVFSSPMLSNLLQLWHSQTGMIQEIDTNMIPQVTEKTGVKTQFDKVYTTIGAHDLKPLVPGNLATLSQMESVSIMAVNLWFPEPNLKPPGFGYLIPRSVSQEVNPHHALRSEERR